MVGRQEAVEVGKGKAADAGGERLRHERRAIVFEPGSGRRLRRIWEVWYVDLNARCHMPPSCRFRLVSPKLFFSCGF